MKDELAHAPFQFRQDIINLATKINPDYSNANKTRNYLTSTDSNALPTVIGNVSSHLAQALDHVISLDNKTGYGRMINGVAENTIGNPDYTALKSTFQALA